MSRDSQRDGHNAGCDRYRLEILGLQNHYVGQRGRSVAILSGLMKIHAVFNRDGGTFRTTDMDAYCGRAAEIFGNHGHVFSCEIVAGSDVEHVLQKGARRDDLDALIAGGGDGTISTAAAVCWREGMPLGVVPAG
jgi:hypothetical protein